MTILVFLTSLLGCIFIGIPVAWILIVILGLWVGYRVIRGWMALFGERAIAA